MVERKMNKNQKNRNMKLSAEGQKILREAEAQARYQKEKPFYIA